MKKYKKIIALGLISAMSLLAFGCGKKDKKENSNSVTTETAAFMDQTDALPVIEHEGVYNDLTGEWNTEKKEEYGRPIAVMINNIADCMPQSDVAKADIIYEFKVEGGITRLLALFNDYSNIEKLGSIRSCRPYYVVTALEYDAIYVHYGQSPQGQDMLNKTKIDHVSGLSAEGTIAFYRADDKVAPHNVYTNTEMLNAGIEYIKAETKHSEDFEYKFKFNEEDKELESETVAKNVKLAISSYTSPYFEYDETNKVYKRFQYGKEHIDELTGEQLTFKNLIIEYAHYESIDDHDRQSLALTGEGTGWYITDGKAVKVTWTKEKRKTQTKYYLEDGTEIKLNPGKTYICLFESDNPDGVTFE